MFKVVSGFHGDNRIRPLNILDFERIVYRQSFSSVSPAILMAKNLPCKSVCDVNQLSCFFLNSLFKGALIKY